MIKSLFNYSTYLCFLISEILPRWAPNLSAGLSRHNFLIKLNAYLLTVGGNSIASIPCRMILYVLKGSPPEIIKLHTLRYLSQKKTGTFHYIYIIPVNGGVPVKSSYIKTPSDQKSALRSCPLFNIISGAKIIYYTK